jgi:hypothetical protein
MLLIKILTALILNIHQIEWFKVCKAQGLTT